MPDFLLNDAAGFSKLTYKKWGSGPVLMLLHGFPENSGLWRKVAPLLADRFTVLCPDMPGAGGSSGFENGEPSMEAIAEAVAAIVDAEGVETFLLAGHSMGGYAALAFAERFGHRLRGLSLIHSTATPDSEEKKSQRQKSIDLIRRGGKDAFIREAVPAMFSSKTREVAPELVGEQLTRGKELPAESAIAFYQAIMSRSDRSDVLRDAAFPVQWILGEEDSILPLDKVLELTHLSQRAFVRVYENVGHLSMLEAPERLAADVADFAGYCLKT